MAGSVSASTLAIGSLALGAAGTGLTVMGQLNQQASAGAQASYMAQVQRQQQQLQQTQAQQTLQQGDVAAEKDRQLTAQKIGTQTAQLAAEGTDLSGSPADILSDTAKAGELDASTIKNNAARTAWGYQVGAGVAGGNAGLYSAFQPSALGAGASLLGGASTLSDKWSKFMWPGTTTTGAYNAATGVNNGVMNGP